MRWALCCQVQNSKPSKDARTPIFYAFHRNGLLGHRYSPLLFLSHQIPPPPCSLFYRKRSQEAQEKTQRPSLLFSHIFPSFLTSTTKETPTP